MLCPGAVQLTADAGITHVAQRQHHVLLRIKHGTTTTVDQGVAFQQFIQRLDRAQRRQHTIVNPAPRLRDCPRRCRVRGLP